MSDAPIIIGHRKKCYSCGYPIRTVILPRVDPGKWQLCDDFDDVPQYIRLHDCPAHPKHNDTV